MEKTMVYLGIDIRCAVESLRNSEFPAMDCLLPLIWKLLGYLLVTALTIVNRFGMEKIMDYLGIDIGCAVESLQNGEFPAKDCVLPLISKLLGYFLVAASTIVKVPQMMKIVKHKSVKGLSVVAFELEVVGYTISLAYCLQKGIPFSAFGEVASLLIQALILVACIYYYSRPLSVTTWARAILYFAIAPTVFAGQIDPWLFEALYASKHLIFLSAKLPQIWKNFKDKSTGELSFLTCLMNFGGSMARVFTSIQESVPFSILMGIVIAISTNGIIMAQILLYWNKGKEAKQVKVTKTL